MLVAGKDYMCVWEGLLKVGEEVQVESSRFGGKYYEYLQGSVVMAQHPSETFVEINRVHVAESLYDQTALTKNVNHYRTAFLLGVSSDQRQEEILGLPPATRETHLKHGYSPSKHPLDHLICIGPIRDGP